MPHHHRVLQIEPLDQRRQVVGIRVHLVAVPRLRGAPVPPPVMRNHATPALAEKQHLSFPVIRAKRPAMGKNSWPTSSPILVKNRRAIVGGDRRYLALLH